MRHLVFLALDGLLLVPLAEAASFDCEKAERANKKTVYTSRALNDGDVETSVKYRFLRGPFTIGDRDAIQDRQQGQLHERRRCGGDTDCFFCTYTQRIDKLNKQYAGIDKPL